MHETLPGLEPEPPQVARPEGRIVRVQPDITSVRRSFDYEVPVGWESDGRADNVRVGSLVRIDFNGRRTAGWVVETGVEPSPGVEILPLAKWSSVGPPAELIELAEWASWRWAGRVPHFLRAASPPKMVHRVGSILDLPDVTSASGRLAAFEGGLTLVQTTPLDNGLELALAAASLGRALVLVPTMMHRKQLATELRGRGIPVAEYPEQWERSAAGAVTIGTRLAAWAPVPDLASIVVLDEHDDTYKEERTPAWNARDVCIERASRHDIPCVLASPSPSLEALESTDRRLVPSRAALRGGWPIVDVVDMRKVDTPGLLTERIVPILRGPGPVACILNRKGRARMLSCSTCDSLATCEACAAAVTQPDDDSLVCGSCGTSRPIVCTECGATKFKLIRPGIGRVAEDLRALARTDVVEVSAETPARDLSGDRLLIGTEALLRRLPSARAVIFLDFDQELAVPRVRAAEDAFALLALAARRVGPREGGGRIVMQTRRPEDVVIQAALHGDPDRVARAQRDVRQVFSQPPYGAWAVASGAGAEAYIAELRDRLVHDDPKADVDAPRGRLDSGAPASQPATKGEEVDVLRIDQLGDRWRIAARSHATLLDAINSTPRPVERLRLEVDPIDL